MDISTILKVFLSALVAKSPKGYHCSLRGKFSFVAQFLYRKFPMLQEKRFTIGTRTYWLLHNIKDFPKCKCAECQRHLSHKNAIVTTGYGAGYCSVECEMKDEEHKAKLREIFQLEYGANSFPESQQFKIAMHEASQRKTPNEKAATVQKREATCMRNFKVRNVLCNGPIRDQFRIKSEEIHGVKNWNNSAKNLETRAKHKAEDPNFQTNINAKTAATRQQNKDKDPHYLEKISAKCQATKNFNRANDKDYDKKILEKTMATNLKNTGYCWPSQDPKIRHKMRRKYTYNGIMFDSAPEIAYYIWLSDQKIEFIYHPNVDIWYEADGKMHHYEPDFFLVKEKNLQDIKGDHFFKPCFIRFQEPKMKCMKEHGVEMITSSMYKKYMQYCQNKFRDSKWYLQFKNF